MRLKLLPGTLLFIVASCGSEEPGPPAPIMVSGLSPTTVLVELDEAEERLLVHQSEESLDRIDLETGEVRRLTDELATDPRGLRNQRATFASGSDAVVFPEGVLEESLRFTGTAIVHYEDGEILRLEDLVTIGLPIFERPSVIGLRTAAGVRLLDLPSRSESFVPVPDPVAVLIFRGPDGPIVVPFPESATVLGDVQDRRGVVSFSDIAYYTAEGRFELPQLDNFFASDARSARVWCAVDGERLLHLDFESGEVNDVRGQYFNVVASGTGCFAARATGVGDAVTVFRFDGSSTFRLDDLRGQVQLRVLRGGLVVTPSSPQAAYAPDRRFRLPSSTSTDDWLEAVPVNDGLRILERRPCVEGDAECPDRIRLLATTGAGDADVLWESTEHELIPAQSPRRSSFDNRPIFINRDRRLLARTRVGPGFALELVDVRTGRVTRLNEEPFVFDTSPRTVPDVPWRRVLFARSKIVVGTIQSDDELSVRVLEYAEE